MSDLIECPSCKSKISSDATSCPKCGQPITDEIKNQAIEKQKTDKKNGKIGCITLVIILLVVGYFFGKDDKSTDNSKTSTTTTPAIEQELGFINKYYYDMPKDAVEKLSKAQSCNDGRPQDLCINNVRINNVNLTERFFFNKNNKLDTISLTMPNNEKNAKKAIGLVFDFGYTPVFAQDDKKNIDSITMLNNNENLGQKFGEFVINHSGTLMMICVKQSELESLLGKTIFNIDQMLKSLSPNVATLTVGFEKQKIRMDFAWVRLGSGNI